MTAARPGNRILSQHWRAIKSNKGEPQWLGWW
jgi:hypothetical protein